MSNTLYEDVSQQRGSIRVYEILQAQGVIPGGVLLFTKMCLAEGIHKGALNSAPLWIPSAETHLRRKNCSSRMTLTEIEDDTERDRE